MQWIKDSLGLFGVLAACAVLILSPFSRNLDLRWLDFQFRWWRAHQGIVAEDTLRIVGIDDIDLKEFGVPIAILHRQLGEFLTAMVVARPKAVGFDVLLPEHSYDALTPSLDATLARSIILAKRSFPVVFGLGADAEGNARAVHPLFASLLGDSGLGFIHVLNDADGTIRRFDERISSSDSSLPTLVGQIARSQGINVYTGTINYLVGDTFRYTPLRDVLRWKATGDERALRQTFEGKLVLLGSTLAYDDLHRASVPLGTLSPEELRSYGVLIHGQQLRSLLTESLLQTLPTGIALMLSFLLSATWFLKPSWGSWLSVSLVVSAVLLLGLFLLRLGWIIPSMALAGSALIGLGGRTGVTAWVSSRERTRLRATFDGFVSPKVLKEILAGHLKPDLEGERREICVLFSDIRGFTTLSESLPPETVTTLLNRYFESMTKVVHRHGGTLDKFIGDGIMAFFGAPSLSTTACQDAFLTARDMLQALSEFNADQLKRGLPQLSIGIGLHFGPAIIGYVGSMERHEYSAIGDTVNTSSRIEGLTKELAYALLMSDTVYARLTDHEDVVELGMNSLKGRSAIKVYGFCPIS